MRPLATLLLSVLLVLAVQPASAEDQPDGDPMPAQAEDPGLVDKQHDAISSSIQDSAAWLDSFFSDERFEAENNKTRIKIKSGVSWERGRDANYTMKFGMRLALPGTGKRLHLLIGGDGDDDSDLEDTREDETRDKVTDTDSENVAVGMQYFILDKAKNHLSAVAGLRFSGSTPIGVFGARYRHYWSSEPWGVRFTQRGLWLTSNELLVPSRIDFERPVAADILFRQTLSGTWFESEDGYFYNADFALIQRLGHKQAISYELTNQFQTEPSNRLEETAFRLKYRQAVWRDWLLLDITPQLALPRERDFDLTPGIYVGFEIRFGG